MTLSNLYSTSSIIPKSPSKIKMITTEQIIFQDIVGQWIQESGKFRQIANGYEWVGEEVSA